MSVNTMTIKKYELSEELLASLLADYKQPEDLIGEHSLLKQLTRRLVEKTLKGAFGELPIEIPRDRHGSFEPQLIPKHQIRWAGFDDKIISLFARGMTVREIQSHLQEM